MNMELFLDKIPDDKCELKEPLVKIDNASGKLHVAKFNSETMELSIQKTNDDRKGKLKITIAVFHGMVQEIIKFTEQGKAVINLINYASAMSECVDTSTNIGEITPKKLLWLFLLNLKDNRKYVAGKDPPPFDGCNRGEAFANFRL